MLFTLFKLFKAIILPPSLILIGMIWTMVALYQKRTRLASKLLFAVTAMYFLLSIEPTAYLLSLYLEQHSIATTSEQSVPPQAIVILGSSATKQKGVAELSGISWQRLWRGLEIYRFYDGQIPIIYSGGSGDPFDTISEEALLAKHYATLFGVPEAQFLVEPSSRDTYESAVAVKQILRTLTSSEKTDSPHIALITSANHILRARKTMEKAGLSIIPYPAHFNSSRFRITPLSILPSYDSFSNSVRALTEWIGIAAYRLRGRL